MAKTPKHCIRTGPNTLEIEGVEVKNCIYANEDVPIEDSAVDELKALLDVQKTADAMYAAKPRMFTRKPRVVQVNLSPDFHKGAGIPIGTTLVTEGMVIPQASGSDINCGVRLLSLGINAKDLVDRLDRLEPILRKIFFEGGRNIPLSQVQRKAIITTGLIDLEWEKENSSGIWKFFNQVTHNRELSRTRHNGGFNTKGKSFGLEDYLSRKGISRDSQIGSIGGGNHFVELQCVEKILNKTTAWLWGLKKGYVVAMIHSGSVNIGHLCGGLYKSLVRDVYKRTGLKFPENDIFPLPDGVPEYTRFWTMLHNAANFAFANRMFLGMMLKQALGEVGLPSSLRLIYDTPHNLAWPANSEGHVVHRKGTSPACGQEWSYNRGFDRYCGEPVLIPGSMGSASFVMEGCGNEGALYSASHGAGRSLSRGKALKYDDEVFQTFLREFRIVTPIDPQRHDIRGRKDILKKYHESLKKEAPFAYKDVYPVVNTLRDARIAMPVAELRPLLTVKGN